MSPDDHAGALSTRELMTHEDHLWAELHELIDSLPRDAVGRPGYFPEGWSAKDLVAHLGSWLAEAGASLEQIRFGTYRADEIDIDGMNARFHEALADVSYADVLSQTHAARNRMLAAWGAVAEPSPDADHWVRKAGPEHYDEHLPRLRDWVSELT